MRLNQHNNHLDIYIRMVFGEVWIRERTPKDTCLKAVGLDAQNTPTILGSIFNMIGLTCLMT